MTWHELAVVNGELWRSIPSTVDFTRMTQVWYTVRETSPGLYKNVYDTIPFAEAGRGADPRNSRPDG